MTTTATTLHGTLSPCTRNNGVRHLRSREVVEFREIDTSACPVFATIALCFPSRVEFPEIETPRELADSHGTQLSNRPGNSNSRENISLRGTSRFLNSFFALFYRRPSSRGLLLLDQGRFSRPELNSPKSKTPPVPSMPDGKRLDASEVNWCPVRAGRPSLGLFFAVLSERSGGATWKTRRDRTSTRRAQRTRAGHGCRPAHTSIARTGWLKLAESRGAHRFTRSTAHKRRSLRRGSRE